MKRAIANVIAFLLSPLLVLAFVAWLFATPPAFRGDRL